MNHPVVSSAPKGRQFIRALIVRGVGAAIDPDAAETFARGRWGAGLADRIAKAAVPALTSADVGNPAATEFFDRVRELSIPGRLSGLRLVPFGVRMLAMTAGSRGYWVGQAKPKPLSKPAVMGATLASRKVAAIVPVTREALFAAGPVAEAALQRDLERAVAEALDVAFIDSTNAGIADEMPASITNGVAPIPSTGDPSQDIAALIAGFAGDLASAYFITDPQTAARIALARDGGGSFAFPDAGPRGGTILGIPLLTSRGSPQDSAGGQIALVDASGVALAMESLDIEVSEHATLLMADDPDEGAAAQVSLWQTNTVAFRAEVLANWDVQRAGAVAVVTGASYGSAS
ncbi:MAG: phage major capsid protein [Dokdonella sp.]|nr:phage major capsid protein [Dokdonella sp.]